MSETERTQKNKQKARPAAEAGAGRYCQMNIGQADIFRADICQA